ncbi:MAG: C40 family peptidase [Treponema sp.]|nr:C40 family peptidase [Treponema sp.]
MRHKKLLALLITSSLFVSSMFADEASSTRSKFIAAAKTYLGVRYVYGGTTRAGLDCSGFVGNAARDAGISLPRTAAAMYSSATRISDSERQPGDLIFFSVGSSITHVAIYLGDNQVIHCVSDGPKTGVIISQLSENYWKTHYHSAGRIIAASKAPSSTHTTKPAPSASNNNTSSSQDTNTTSPKPKKKRRATAYFDVDGYFDWTFFTHENQYGFIPQGGSLQTEIRLNTWNMNPGIRVGYTYHQPFGEEAKFNPFACFSLPLSLTLHINDYVTVYSGAILSTGTVCKDYQRFTNSEKELQAPIYPGIFGVSFNTPTFNIGKSKVAFVQDISFTYYQAAPGYEPLTLKETLAAGTSFQTGVRVSLPIYW